MNMLSRLLTLTLPLFWPATCQNQRTYWIDASCQRRFGFKMQDAVEDALISARTGADRLDSGDRLQLEYFRRLFSPPGRPGQPEYEDRLRMVKRRTPCALG